ncbi:hypothetical protein I4I73_27110 [Pseudonocardia sp. KRD-184]|uniref:Uncharacterized protein n=1 Tax=Pseudonocardia oceani TaxID=2792013 RepID=A0ABS6UG91_9PSEU|nr:hypothetical protein [Pseudonocardia oceani]MBW0092907.1 hypothetical protein [Pseudonocardia oceani]MBW0099663.1 hypothetical protein [Pseudonocardia oceani]MBW0112177.1 hypothetical protein [Pseudonocardia oceani]MBW0125620.1 hypothetical protein [Pseudonocardia oceani]MBW0131244.1 hypothetical protein [Pseudonocardia oceani]
MADAAADDPAHGTDADDGPGDPVCWLHRLCPECGAMPSEGDDGERCWRCGTPYGPGA